MNTKLTINEPEMYEIRVADHLSENWERRFEGLTLRQQPEGETVLSGMLDQAGLHGVLAKVRDLGLKLISINRIEKRVHNEKPQGR